MSNVLVPEFANKLPSPDQVGPHEWLNWQHGPAMIIESNGDLVAFNDAARLRLEDGFPFRMFGRRVVSASDTLSEELKLAIGHRTHFEVIERHPESNCLVLIKGIAVNAQFYLRITPLEHEGGLFSRVVMGSSLQLTRAETRVLSMIFTDLTASQIAERLGLSVETVRTHRKRVYAKLGVNGRASVLTLFARAFET